MTRAPLILLALVPGLSWAACPVGESPVFSCLTTAGKQIRVCQGQDAINYRYGKPGKAPELTLSTKNTAFDWEHGEAPRVGILDYLTFKNASTRYTITHQAGYDDPESATAHLTVFQGKAQRNIDCASAIRFNAKAIKARPKEISEGTP